MKQDTVEVKWEKRVVALVMSILILALDGTQSLARVKSVAERMTARFEWLGMGATSLVKAPLSGFRFLRSGTMRLSDLEGKFAERITDEVRLTELEQENLELREMLSAMPKTEHRYVVAKVVGISREMMTITAGEDQGLEIGSSVVVGEVLVGRLSKVSRSVSQVRLLVNSESKVAVEVSGTRVRGVVVGGHDGLELDEVLQTDNLKAGEILVTSGVDGVIPGLVVGVVEEVGSVDSSVFRKAAVKPAFEARQPSTVLVIVSELTEGDK